MNIEIVNAFPIPIGVLDIKSNEFDTSTEELLNLFEDLKNQVGDNFLSTEEDEIDSKVHFNTLDGKKNEKIINYISDNLLLEYFLATEVRIASKIEWSYINKLKSGSSKSFNKNLDCNYVVMFPLKCNEDQTIDIVNPNSFFESKKLKVLNPNIFNSKFLSFPIKNKCIIMPSSTLYEIRAKDDFTYVIIGFSQ